MNISDIQKVSTDTVWFFRFKKTKSGDYLITNDAGRYHFLSEVDFHTYISWDAKSLGDYNELVQKGFIKTPDYERWHTTAYAARSHFVGQWPTLHMMVMTLRCNHHCKYCHAAVAPMTATGLDMDKETATKCVDTILHTNSQSLTIEFQWGEALINWEVLQHVVEYASVRANYLDKHLTFSLVTNLTLMTEEKLQWLMDKGVDICTSLDGNEFNHNNNRTWYDGNSFEKVTYWIQRINQIRKERNLPKIWALLTVTRENLPHYKAIIDSYIELGLNGIFLRWLNPYGFAAADIKKLAYDADDWLKFYTDSLDYILELNKQWVDFREQITSVYLMKILNDRDPAFMDIRSPSGIAIWGVAYNYDGKVYASDESRMLWRMWIDDFLLTDMKETWWETYTAMLSSDVTKISVQSSCLDGLPGYNDHVYKPYLWVDIIHNFKMTDSLYLPLAKDQKMKLQIWILDYIFDKLQNDPEAAEIFTRWSHYRFDWWSWDDLAGTTAHI